MGVRGSIVAFAVFAAVFSVSKSEAQLAEALQERSFNLVLEGGWRYPLSGQGRVDRTPDRFPLSYHASAMIMAGEGAGLYALARFDGFGPTGRSGFPFGLSARLGYFIDMHRFDPGGIRSSTSTRYNTECRDYTSRTELCTTTRTTTTRRWWEPAGWIHGARYFYAGYRQLINVERHDLDERPDDFDRLTNRGAISLGIGATESKFGTFTNEVELLYYIVSGDDSNRSKWGVAYRGQAFIGPVFVDFNLLLDAGLGGELSVGLGFIIAP
ncbi:MAG: hypothetical protein AAF411_17845 [Myxococcota bacterium]